MAKHASLLGISWRKNCKQKMYGLVRLVGEVVLDLPRRCMKTYSKVVGVKMGHSMKDNVFGFNHRIENLLVLVRK